jgi:hypothetical protein
MDEEQNKPNFWRTLPGILTGSPITAVGGLLVALHYHGKAKPQDHTTVVDQPKTLPEQPHKAIVTSQKAMERF